MVRPEDFGHRSQADRATAIAMGSVNRFRMLGSCIFISQRRAARWSLATVTIRSNTFEFTADYVQAFLCARFPG